MRVERLTHEHCRALEVQPWQTMHAANLADEAFTRSLIIAGPSWAGMVGDRVLALGGVFDKGWRDDLMAGAGERRMSRKSREPAARGRAERPRSDLKRRGGMQVPPENAAPRRRTPTAAKTVREHNLARGIPDDRSAEEIAIDAAATEMEMHLREEYRGALNPALADTLRQIRTLDAGGLDESNEKEL